MKKIMLVVAAVMICSTGFAVHNTWLGPSGLFQIYTAENLEGTMFAGSLYFSNYDREFSSGDMYVSYDYSYLTLPLAYGITDRFEVSVAPAYLDIRSEYPNDPDGFGDVYLNLKANIFHDRDMGGFGVVAYGKLPTADEDEGLGTGEADYGLTLVGSKYFGKMKLHLNLGYRFIGEPDYADFDDQFIYGLGMQYHFTDQFQLIAELTGETAYHPNAEDPLDILAGFRYELSEVFTFGGGVRYAFDLEDENCPVGGVVQLGVKVGGKPTPTPIPPTPIPMPEIRCILESAEITQGEFTRVRVEVTDPTGGELQFDWSSSGCRLETDGREAILYTDDCGPGEFTVSCKVTNEMDYSDSCSVTVMVKEKPPQKKIVKLDLPVVPFKKGTRVDNVAKAILDDIAQKIKENPDVTVTLVGHTDSTGSESANEKVGMTRAENVKKYLVDRHKIEPDRFEVRSAGETEPIADNDTMEGRMKNRRVEVIMMVETWVN